MSPVVGRIPTSIVNAAGFTTEPAVSEPTLAAQKLAAVPAPELEPPVEPAWAIGGIGISEFDATTQRLTLQMDELVPEDETDGGVARIGVTLPQVLALAVRGETAF